MSETLDWVTNLINLVITEVTGYLYARVYTCIMHLLETHQMTRHFLWPLMGDSVDINCLADGCVICQFPQDLCDLFLSMREFLNSDCVASFECKRGITYYSQPN